MPTLAEMQGWKRPLAKDPFDPEEKYLWHRRSAQGGDVKSRFGFSSEFIPEDKGWKTIFSIFFPFYGGFRIIRKQKRTLINVMSPEWYRQREEDFIWLHGITSQEAKKDRALFIDRSNARQEHFRKLGLI